MNPYLLAFLLLSNGQMQVAVRTPGGAVHATEFPNTEEGAAAFQAWAASTAGLRPRAPANGCIASQSQGDAPLYGSPFFKVAYELRGSTAVWAEPIFEAHYPGVTPADRTAALMFSHCQRTIVR